MLPVDGALSPRCCAALWQRWPPPCDATATDCKEIIVGGSLRGKLVADVESKGEQFAQYVLVNWLRPDTLRRLRWHQRNGHRIVLVSASLAAYLRPMALRLGIDDVLCTDSARSGDRYGDRLDRPQLPGRGEAAAVRPVAARNSGGSMRRCGRTATAHGDRELLDRADHAVWVNGETISEITRGGCWMTAALFRQARPKQWVKNLLVFAAPACGRRARRLRLAVAGNRHVHRVLPGQQRHVLLERPARRRQRSQPPDQAASPDRQLAPYRPGSAASSARSCWSPASGWRPRRVGKPQW